MNFVIVVLVGALIATVFSLIGGMSSMVAHGETGHHTSEQWMIMRVLFQAIAVAMVLLLVYAQV